MQKVIVKVDKWDGFEINSYTQHMFYVNRKSEFRHYYRCKNAKKDCKAVIKVKFDNLTNEAELTFVSEHNHVLTKPNIITKSTYHKIDDIMNSNNIINPDFLFTGTRIYLTTIQINLKEISRNSKLPMYPDFFLVILEFI